MTPTERNRSRAHGALICSAVIAIATVAVLWGWNTFAAGVLGLPEIQFRHALAFELFICATLAPVALFCRVARPRA